MLSFPFTQPGIAAALASAALFGAGTPLAKLLLDDVDPWMLAGLLYLGSGLGLGVYRLARRMKSPTLRREEWGWLALAVLLGGGIGPVLLMWGLAGLSASHAALLLNAESVFTALLAWGLFRENVDRRVALGMGAIVAGALALSWPGQGLSGDAVLWSALGPALAVLGACLAWGLDNNLTRKVSLNDASWIACVKGLVAGGVNLALALWVGNPLPGAGSMAAAMGVGLLAYGVSLALFVLGLRHLGASRAGAYFSTAPFVGALVAVLLLGEPVTGPLLFAAGLMALGVWLHLTEHHAHLHRHEAVEHEHTHRHDIHHQHLHTDGSPPGDVHSHRHRHQPLVHSHAHFPDAHHRHDH
jgi:drug/metabolite transporter (DMT)-like permease